MATPIFRIKRIALAANILTPIYPPFVAKALSVGNATSGDLEVHTSDDETEYLVIASGYERSLPINLHLFLTERIACWLKATNAGTAVLLWY